MRKQPDAGLGPVAVHPTHSDIGPRSDLQIFRCTQFDASRRGEKMLNCSRNKMKARSGQRGERVRHVTPDLRCFTGRERDSARIPNGMKKTKNKSMLVGHETVHPVALSCFRKARLGWGIGALQAKGRSHISSWCTSIAASARRQRGQPLPPKPRRSSGVVGGRREHPRTLRFARWCFH